MTWIVLLALTTIIALLWGWHGQRNLRRELAYLRNRPVVAPTPPADPFNQLFRTLSAALDAGVIVVNDGRTIRYCNDVAAKLFGVSANAVVNHSVITLVRDYQADTMIEQSIRRRDPQQVTLQPVLSNRTIRIWCEPMPESGALILARDLTQLSLLERARRDLVANVSHELRTPLASIKLLVETLATQPPPELAQRMLGQVDTELDAVMQLVDELHELSQIESGRTALQLQPTPVEDIVERANDRIQPQAKRKDLRVAVTIAPDLPEVYVDRDRISQVLLNLLHNAVKWTDAGGTITIEAGLRSRGELGHHLSRMLEPSNRWVIMAIHDTGAGIPAEAIPRIFERFYKVDRARTRGVGGTGLGLAIVKHLVEGHGGVVWVASSEGRGSTFTVALPVVEDD